MYECSIIMITIYQYLSVIGDFFPQVLYKLYFKKYNLMLIDIHRRIKYIQDVIHSLEKVKKKIFE